MQLLQPPLHRLLLSEGSERLVGLCFSGGAIPERTDEVQPGNELFQTCFEFSASSGLQHPILHAGGHVLNQTGLTGCYSKARHGSALPGCHKSGPKDDNLP